MIPSSLFELCADSLQAAMAAQAGGADRIELCDQLAIGGVTPGAALLAATLDRLSIPVHVLIRPRGGDFVYTPEEFQLMRRQIAAVKLAGAAGVAIGILLPDGRVDRERTAELAALARPMHVTFHRAFDESRDLEEALEEVIALGADTLLSSGGAPNVLVGADRLGRLRHQAGNRMQMMAGAGLKLDNLVEVVRRSGITCLHGSLKRSVSSGFPPSQANGLSMEHSSELVADIREAVRLLQIETLQPAGRG